MYRVGVIMNTAIGNMTRYQNLRKYSERISDVEIQWAAVNYYTQKVDRPRWASGVPDPLYVRASVLNQIRPVVRNFHRLDAVVMHLYEADLITTLARRRWPHLVRISSTDDAPVVNPATYPLYAAQIARPEWRKQVRLKIDLWRTRHTDYFIPHSNWVGDLLVNDCGIPRRRVQPIHVGVDLERWTFRPPVNTDRLPRILFVGSEFERKGGPLLLDVFSREFSGKAELHLVTKQRLDGVPANVFVHQNLNPNDGSLARLYESSDMVVVPTTADTGPLWVFLEALAIGRPVIGTLTGANAEVVLDGETGYSVPIGDGTALALAIRTLLDDPQLRIGFGKRGRLLVEQRFDSRVNVPRIFEAIKAQIDARREAGSPVR